MGGTRDGDPCREDSYSMSDGSGWFLGESAHSGYSIGDYNLNPDAGGMTRWSPFPNGDNFGARRSPPSAQSLNSPCPRPMSGGRPDCNSA
ncbi:MAG: hypothetical protein HOP29_10805 [Phycisphaerales bacterium]|nr:hypothetical protein [Phycisphaerales bacterium]